MIAETLTDLNYKVIENTEKLREIIPELENESAIAIDTEGSRFDPFSAKLLLLQLATTKKAWVIDCAKVDLSLLKHILESTRPLKIVQNAKFDYELLKVQAEIQLGSVFDTMLAERIITCGISREISLKTIAEKLLGVNLQKSNWIMQRGTYLFFTKSFGNNLRLFKKKILLKQLNWNFL